MSKQIDSKKQANFIENSEDLAKELFGYDDETLLRELKEAELELEQMKAQDSELETQIQAETEAGFEALMQKIQAENIKPVTEREYTEKKKEEERKVTKLKPALKVMFVAAAILVVLSGMGSVVSARKEFEYYQSGEGHVRNKTIWQNGDYKREHGQLEEAYEQIGETLGIDVLILGYKPSEMTFEELLIDKGYARIKFLYKDKIIYLKETKKTVDKVYDYVVSDRKEIETVYNSWLDYEFQIEANDIDDGFIEYSTKFEYNGAYYYFAGVMEKEEFIKIVSLLNFLQI